MGGLDNEARQILGSVDLHSQTVSVVWRSGQGCASEAVAAAATFADLGRGDDPSRRCHHPESRSRLKESSLTTGRYAPSHAVGDSSRGSGGELEHPHSHDRNRPG